MKTVWWLVHLAFRLLFIGLEGVVLIFCLLRACISEFGGQSCCWVVGILLCWCRWGRSGRSWTSTSWSPPATTSTRTASRASMTGSSNNPSPTSTPPRACRSRGTSVSFSDLSFPFFFRKLLLRHARFCSSVLGNHDYRGNALAQLNPVMRKLDERFICMRSFVVNAGTWSYFVWAKKKIIYLFISDFFSERCYTCKNNIRLDYHPSLFSQRSWSSSSSTPLHSNSSTGLTLKTVTTTGEEWRLEKTT